MKQNGISAIVTGLILSLFALIALMSCKRIIMLVMQILSIKIPPPRNSLQSTNQILLTGF